MTEHFDSLETRDPAAREASQLALLPDLIRRAMTAPGWAAQLGAIDPAGVSSRAGLAALPVLRKGDLKDKQQAAPPFAGFNTTPVGQMGRIFLSPGPIFEPEGRGTDWWRSARCLYAAGFRKGDIAHNTFSYHLTPGAWLMDAGLRAIGCAVIPAGVGNTEQQLDAIVHLRPTGYVGAPDFLKVLLDKAKETGRDVSSISKALVSGGALFPSLRHEYAERGVAVLQAYGTADAGMLAYETRHDGKVLDGMIVDEGVILEIVRPGTGDPVADGEVGEVVVTVFNREYPMIRFGTGDLSAILAGASPCGRTNKRIKGWMGRADQTTKVKGMFVHPEQIAAVAKRHPELGRLRLVVSRVGEQDTMILKAETANPDAGLAVSIAATLKDLTKMKGDVELTAPGSLPNDGKVIADERTYG